MRIAFCGTPDFAVPSLQMLIDEGHDGFGENADLVFSRGCVILVKPDAVRGVICGSKD